MAGGRRPWAWNEATTSPMVSRSENSPCATGGRPRRGEHAETMRKWAFWGGRRAAGTWSRPWSRVWRRTRTRAPPPGEPVRRVRRDPRAASASRLSVAPEPRESCTVALLGTPVRRKGMPRSMGLPRCLSTTRSACCAGVGPSAVGGAGFGAAGTHGDADFGAEGREGLFLCQCGVRRPRGRGFRRDYAPAAWIGPPSSASGGHGAPRGATWAGKWAGWRGGATCSPAAIMLYLVRFAQWHVEFRMPELDSLLALCGVDPEEAYDGYVCTGGAARSPRAPWRPFPARLGPHRRHVLMRARAARRRRTGRRRSCGCGCRARSTSTPFCRAPCW